MNDEEDPLGLEDVELERAPHKPQDDIYDFIFDHPGDAAREIFCAHHETVSFNTVTGRVLTCCEDCGLPLDLEIGFAE